MSDKLLLELLVSMAVRDKQFQFFGLQSGCRSYKPTPAPFDNDQFFLAQNTVYRAVLWLFPFQFFSKCFVADKIAVIARKNSEPF
jgi:hypothetical protein